ncbi:UPF0160 protein MYG1, mitochondrial isoform X2 [Oopsacas minuta]|uniref:UPF0160 protein MYG1, mitochondrial isoform X2 n=1 Tax=Oopsacas minuta TaxID=111878 RepID=A0AAV7JKD8_9METZ|nr:UPF0160 protein MYG1, mitochondrial isoform X2 [Oopsacas minuta]
MRRFFYSMAELINIKTIGTHNGTFHCDDALACYMLKTLPECNEAKIIRSRDLKVLDECDIIVDVGAVFDPSKHRYDHHQREFKETMHSLSSGKYQWSTKLSSAGLVYFHFGHRVISKISSLPLEDPNLEIIYRKMYEQFMEEIDANDNGISQCDGQPKFKITTTVSARVSYLLPAWNEVGRTFDEIFPEAMELVGSEFTSRVKSLINAWLPTKYIVEQALMHSLEIDPSGEIILLSQYCPWKDHLFDIEIARRLIGTVKYVLYEGEQGMWRIQCVAKQFQHFVNRKSLPEPWRGLRDSELSEVSGIHGCTFVHSSGFTGGNVSKEGVILMAKRALEFEEELCEVKKIE